MSDTPTPGNAERQSGYYWITCAGSEPEVAHYVDRQWWLTGVETALEAGVEVLIDRPLVAPPPPDRLAAAANEPVTVRSALPGSQS
jgi:hypothetical protein